MQETIKYVHPATPGFVHKPQLDFLNIPVIGKKVAKLHFISGRSGGKTAAAVMKVLDVCIKEPGTVGLVLAPTYQMLQRSFLREWMACVPRKLWTYNSKHETIRLINGSMFYLSTRKINNPSAGKDVTRGNTLNWVVDDEAALGFDHEMFTNTMAAIRRRGKSRFYAFTTTPRINDYYDLVHSPGHIAIYSTSRDNPWNDEEWVDDVESQMSEQQAEREIGGKWVHLEGLCWPKWSWDRWPEGNVYEYRHQPSEDWYLFLDLGSSTGAYYVVQQVNQANHQRGMPGRDVWVATTELLPSDDGSASRAFQRLNALYGRPAMVIGGADMGTRASTDGKTATYFVRRVWGGGVPVKAISGWMADKQVQYDALSECIMDVNGHRSLCMASEFSSIGQNSGKAKRGINELIKQDVWPDNVGKSSRQFFAKDGRLEHARDALLYGAVGIMSPPRYTPNKPLAA
jgi:hypothetical protein